MDSEGPCSPLVQAFTHTALCTNLRAECLCVLQPVVKWMALLPLASHAQAVLRSDSFAVQLLIPG